MVRFILPILCAALPMMASEAKKPVTVILDLHDVRYSEGSLSAMKTEAQRILSRAGVSLDWRKKDDLGEYPQFGEVVIFRFTGRCVMDPIATLFDERGPLAATATSDDDVLPFGVVHCDRVKASLRRTFTGNDYARGNELLGTALGRVMAHEMYHMFAGEKGHAARGVAREALTADQLVRGEIGLDSRAAAEIRERQEDGGSR